MLSAVDPDVKKSGVAVFTVDAHLCWVGWVEPFKRMGSCWSTHRLVCEKPFVRPGVPNLDANDLVDLGEVVGWFRGHVLHEEYAGYYPHEWAGGVGKIVRCDRIWRLLRLSEQALFPLGTEQKIQKWLVLPDKKQKNLKDPVLELLDACAIGMFALKRTGVGGARYRP